MKLSISPPPSPAKLIIHLFYAALIFIAVCLALFPSWVKNFFGININAETIVFYASLGITGLQGTDSRVLQSAWEAVVEPAVILATIYIVAALFSRTMRTILKPRYILFLCLISLLIFGNRIRLHENFARYFGEDFFIQYYATPELDQIRAPKVKRNLLLLYVESLETVMAKPENFGRNRLAPLERFAGQLATDFKEMPGTGWSIAGMVGMQCAIPFKPFYKNTLQFIGTDGLLPSATCLGDVLHKDGYEQYFLLGPDTAFAANDKFFASHGYDVLIGLRKWQQHTRIPKDAYSSWGRGISDDELFRQAIKKIEYIASQKKVWNVTVKTSDMHNPHGIFSNTCSQEEKKIALQGVVSCTMRHLADFLDTLKKKGHLNNTVVVITGDHLFMARYWQLSKLFSGERNIYFKILTPDNKPFTRTIMTHFDIVPTILDALGYEYPTHPHFGLGISLYADNYNRKYLEQYAAVSKKTILNHSELYDSFWYTDEKHMQEINEKIAASGPHRR